MRRIKAVFILVICLAVFLIPTVAQAQVEEFTGDIYVYNGQYTVWDGAYETFDVSNVDLVWHTLNSENLLTSEGEAINHNLYIMDEDMLEHGQTSLYFGDLDLGSGGLYSYEDAFICIASGTLQAAEIDIYDTLRLDNANVFVDGDVIAGNEVYSYFCILDVGGNIQAPSVYFDTDDGQLYVTVGGDILAYNYDQEGGSVTVDGNIVVEFFQTADYATAADWENDDNEFSFSLCDSYAHYNFIELKVGGSIYVTQEYGNFFVGYDVWDSTPEGYNNYIPVVLDVAGDIEVDNLIEVYEGNITVGGTISTTALPRKTIYIYGGHITAGEITSSTDLNIGAAFDNYDLNDTIVIDVTGDLSAAYDITIYGGEINVGGTIQTLVAETDTICIYGGQVKADTIDSMSSVVVGSSGNYLGGNGDLAVAANNITALNDIVLYGGVIDANSIYCEGDFYIDDAATLINAVLADGSSSPYNYVNDTNYPLYRTTLSGLIPDTFVDITVEYSNYQYAKNFFTSANDDGEVYVWLVGNSTLSGGAYYGAAATELLSSATVNQEDVVINLDFYAPQDYAAVNIGLDVPDTVFNISLGPAFVPWQSWGGDCPLVVDDWTFTDAAGEDVTGFSASLDDYTVYYFRNGVLYVPDDFYGFLEGNYVVHIASEQAIGDTTYIMAGDDQFTIEPLIVTVEADSKTVTKGGQTPTYTVSISDNSDGYVTLYFNNGASDLFYADSYATTETAGRFPIYLRADCEAYFEGVGDPAADEGYNPYYYDYASAFSGITNLGYSVLYNIENGILTVRTPSSGGGSSATYYTITASAGEGGSIAPQGSVSVKENSVKTFTITADEGYIVDDVLVDGVSVGAVTEYVFPAVAANHTIEAKFAAEGAEDQSPVSQFSDLDPDQWYYEGVDYVLNNQLFNGTSETLFTPDGYMTRAMMVTVLYRLAGSPATDATNPFADVEAGQWYTDAITWAVANGVVMGYSSTTFGPDDYITREQMAIILYNYAKVKGYDVSASADLSAFADLQALNDAGSISTLSLSALKWAVGEQLITGINSTTLDPQGNATRAQVAVILMRFAENITK